MFIVDVSPSMGDTRTVELTPGPNGEKRTIEMSNLQWALKYVKIKVQQMVRSLLVYSRILLRPDALRLKIFTGRKTDKIGVILVGTEGTRMNPSYSPSPPNVLSIGTNNLVSDQHGGYDHVTEYLPIHQPNARTLHKIDGIKPSSEIGDRQ